MNEAQKADVIISSDCIFDGISDTPYAGAVAIAGDRIVAVGDRSKIEHLRNEATIHYDYGDNLLMPGFHDSHVHLILSGLFQTCVNLHSARSEQEAAIMVRDFARTRPQDPWVLGFTWYHIFWDKQELPCKETLDAVLPDRPVFLLDYEGHGAWINSKAMEICGINRDTPNPPGGEIARDAKGEPTGFICESAMSLASRFAYEIPLDMQKDLLMQFMGKAAQFGVTSVSDMQPFVGKELGAVELYKQMDIDGELTVRLNILPELTGDLRKVRLMRDAYKQGKVRFSGLKQFLDGVATTYTALMIEPYSDKPDVSGHPVVDPQEVKQWIQAADEQGFRVRLHACGDGAVRLALDCYENASKVNGKRDARHTIEHIENIHPDDIKRFNELGVTASMQPEHLAMTDVFMDNPYPIRLGAKRSELTWPMQTLLKSGARLVFGSDCPVVDLDPMLGVYRAVSRLHNDGEPLGGWNPCEKLSMAQVLRGYTSGAAFSEFMENELGTLQAGMLADMVVLDRNLFTIPIEEIRNTKAVLTMVDGKVVFEI